MGGRQKGRGNLTLQEKKRIGEMIQNGVLLTEIAEKTGRSLQSIKRVEKLIAGPVAIPVATTKTMDDMVPVKISLIEDSPKSKITIKESEVVKSVSVKDSKKKLIFGRMIEVPSSKKREYVCGLIKDRHAEIPTDEYIYYKAFDKKFINNYQMQYDYANEYFKRNGITKGTKLICYVTGLQCALGSITKVCNDNEVDLTLMHWNPETSKYQVQDVLTFGSKKQHLIQMYGDKKHIKTYTIDAEYTSFRGNTLNMVEIERFGSDPYKSAVFVKGNAEKIYFEFCKSVREFSKGDNYRLSLKEVTLNPNSSFFDRCIYEMRYIGTNEEE